MSVFANAVLVEVARPGRLAANGDPGRPTPVWTGAVAGYLRRQRGQTISGGTTVYVVRDVFIVPRTAGAPVIEQAGADWEAYTVVIDDQRTSTTVRRRFTVRSIDNRAAGLAVDSVRLELDAETAP